MLKKPKICNINFWIENAPRAPPWNFSENSSDLAQLSFPNVSRDGKQFGSGLRPGASLHLLASKSFSSILWMRKCHLWNKKQKLKKRLLPCEVLLMGFPKLGLMKGYAPESGTSALSFAPFHPSNCTCASGNVCRLHRSWHNCTFFVSTSCVLSCL